MTQAEHLDATDVVRRLPTLRLIQRGLFPKAATPVALLHAASDPLYAPLDAHIQQLAARRGFTESVGVFVRDRDSLNADADEGSLLRPSPPKLRLNTGLLRAHGYYEHDPPVISDSLNAVIEHELYHAANTRRDRFLRHAAGFVAATGVMAATHYLGGKLGKGAHKIMQWCATMVSGLFAYDLAFSFFRRQEEFRADEAISKPRAGIQVRELSDARRGPPDTGLLASYDRLLSGHPTSQARKDRHLARLGERGLATSAVERLEASQPTEMGRSL